MNPSRFKFLTFSFIFSLIGLCFSAWNVFDSQDPNCLMLTTCELFVDFTILGISLWWFGIIFFSITLILALFGFVKLGKFVTGIGTLLDTLLLLTMVVTAPCSNCLLEGLLIVIVYFSFYFDSRNKKLPLKIFIPPFVYPWLIALFMLLGNFMIFSTETWQLAGNPNASIRVYFSTSCPACETLIDASGDSDEIAWYPVQENDNDVWSIRYMQEQMKNGSTFKQAYQKLKNNQHEENILDVLSFEHWYIQVQLWKNAAHVMRAGKNALPMVEFHGLPSILLPQDQSYQQNYNYQDSINDQSNMINDILGNVAGACDDTTEIPCP